MEYVPIVVPTSMLFSSFCASLISWSMFGEIVVEIFRNCVVLETVPFVKGVRDLVEVVVGAFVVLEVIVTSILLQVIGTSDVADEQNIEHIIMCCDYCIHI